MKNILKKIVEFIASFSPYVRKRFIDWNLGGRVPFPVIFQNFIFQRIFRVNSKVPFPVNFSSRVIGYDKIILTKDSNTICSFSLSTGCYIQALNGLEIGDNFLFAPGIRIISVNHILNDEFIDEATPSIKIGNNVWLGANVIILPGVSLGNNVIVGAGSVVTKSFPENVVIAGNPAKIIRTQDFLKTTK